MSTLIITAAAFSLFNIVAWAFVLFAVVVVIALVVAAIEVHIEQKEYFKTNEKVNKAINWKTETSEPKKKITSEIQFLLERMAQSPNKN
jgi:hypothetical protein